MNIKTVFIVFFSILTMAAQSSALATTQYSNDLFTQSQSMFCAESSDEKKEDEAASEEEEEPDCD